MNNIPIEMKNGYILIQDIKNETVTPSGLYITDEQYNRFAKVLKVYEGSMLKEGDIVIKPINRDTPLKIDGVVYRAIKESFIFAKLIEDED
jgi:co-chaperonin GroES (HSP10)